MGNLNKVLAYLNELNFKPDLDKFEHKLIIQKTICLLKILNIDAGYEFSLYVKGPYSPSLTHDLYFNKKQVTSLQTSYKVSEKEKETLKSILEFSNGLETTLLEIMATYLFLKFILKKDEKQAITELKKLKSFYSQVKIAVGVSRAKLLLEPSEEDIRKMKVEFSVIESASIEDMNKFNRKLM